ncbi:molybdate ABC transporter permease subunit [Myxococcota bacterium]|nr:molybdate ABC transporter permease subunit [Myxococcota bacterium]
MDWVAIGLSVKLAGITSAALLALGLPLAWWICFAAGRARRVVEALIALPLVLPPTVLGFYLLLALGPRSPVGQLYAAVVGDGLVFSFEGLIVASVLYSLPFSVQPFVAAFEGVDRALIEASWCLGRSSLETFWRVVLPLSARGVLAGVVLTFAHTLGEFGVVLMIGGNLSGETRTVSVAIYDAVQALDYSAAGRTSALLVALSFVTLLGLYTTRGGAPWASRS